MNLVLSALVVLVLAVPDPQLQVDPEKVTRVRTGYLYHIIKQSTWPANNPHATTQGVVVGYLGCATSPFATTLARQLARKCAEVGHVEVISLPAGTVRAATAGSLWGSGWHNNERKPRRILYFCDGETPPDARCIRELHRRNVLTVGESRSFLQQGGALAFVREGKRIRVYVNPPALAQTGVAISAEIRQHMHEVHVTEAGRQSRP